MFSRLKGARHARRTIAKCDTVEENRTHVPNDAGADDAGTSQAWLRAGHRSRLLRRVAIATSSREPPRQVRPSSSAALDRPRLSGRPSYLDAREQARLTDVGPSFDLQSRMVGRDTGERRKLCRRVLDLLPNVARVSPPSLATAMR